MDVNDSTGFTESDSDSADLVKCVNDLERDLKLPATSPEVAKHDHDSDKTLPEAASVKNQEDEIIAYIHNVSPVKKGKYFDCILQTKDSVVRGVCFSPPKLKRFKQASDNDTAVKVKKFRIDTTSNMEDVVMDWKTIIESTPPVNFPKSDLPQSFNLSTLSTLCVGQLISVTAKVAHMQPIKKISSNGKELQLREVTLVDPSSTMKLVLWEEYLDSVAVGTTYFFQHLRIKRDKMTKEIFVNTAMSETKITVCNPFTEALAIAVQTSHVSATGEILGISTVNHYLGCMKCNKKVVATSKAGFLNCDTCPLKQKEKACKKNWYCKVAFEDMEKNEVTLTLFQDTIAQAFEIQHKAFSPKSVSADDIETVIMDWPSSVNISFDQKKKIATSIAA